MVQLIEIFSILAFRNPETRITMDKKASATGGFWMETELLYPKKKQRGFNPVVIRNEEGVVYMHVRRDSSDKEQYRETVKVIAI